MAEAAAPASSPRPGAVAGWALVYVALALVSLPTAYVQANAAAVWIPSGFAVGLLIARGRQLWPAVALGAFAANLAVNLHAGAPLPAAAAVAALVAAGNAAEALLGARLARRHADGPALLERPASLVRFMALVVTLSPLISMGFGVAASRLAGLAAPGALWEVMATWYVANAVGILIVAPLMLILLAPQPVEAPRRRVAEAAALFLLLAFAAQAICGLYWAPGLADWPRAYMVMPLVVWAAFRFGMRGALLSILFIAVVSVIGTMRGFAAFPAATPARSLLYLQLFLAMLSLVTLLIASALTEIAALRAGLEARVGMRTREVERLVADREALLSLVAHDLQSPLLGMRTMLRAALDRLRKGALTQADMLEVTTQAEAASAGMARRVRALLEPSLAAGEDGRAEALGVLVERIASVHRPAMRRRGTDLEISEGADLVFLVPDRLEHVLDILIDNALRFSPRGTPVEVGAKRRGRFVEVSVVDNGPGLAEPSIDAAITLSRPHHDGVRPDGTGIGLGLAAEQATRLGGRLDYQWLKPDAPPNHGRGSRFTLTLPLEASPETI